MKRLLTLTAVMVVVVTVTLTGSLQAQDEEVKSGNCYFQASEDTYLKIYNIGKNGVERTAVWEGFLPAGGTKAFNAPYGQVGFATKQAPNDPWNEDQAGCMDGESIDIP